MSRASDLTARAARLADRAGARPDEKPEPETTVAPVPTPERPARTIRRAAPRATPVRVTADLAPQSYRALIAYSSELAEALGRAKVPHVEIIRALVDRLEVDPELRDAIANDVRTRLSS